jgi:type II secretory pathway pseudopilin PulG
MSSKARRMRGFTLIASLLVLILLSGIAIGMMFLVNSQQRVGGNDLEDNLAFYGAESGMEKMTADLDALYSSVQAPTPAQISVLGTAPYYPNTAEVGSMTYGPNSVSQQTNGAGVPIQRFRTISSGPEQGLNALTMPITMSVLATRPSGASVRMLRTVEVALIPVFQFGVFCSGDCSYFAGPHFGFQGRIHTNGNLFLAANTGPLIIDGKVTAFGEIIRDRLANGWNAGGYNGSVFVPSQTGGCTPWLPNGAGNPPNGSNCLDFGPDINNGTNDASWAGGIPPAGGPNADPTYAAWITAAKQFNGFITNRINGAKLLSLPFVQANNPALGASAQQIQIIRKGLTTDSVPVGNSKLYNKAAIRILLADTQALLHPERPGLADGQDIDLTGGGNANGYQILVNGGGYTRVAMASTAAGWTAAPSLVPALTIPNQPIPGSNNWNLVNGWIRVEYLNTANPPVWVGVTTEWLGYGFARGINVPAAPAPGGNLAHPNAILILQELKNVGATVFDAGVGNPSPSNVNSQSRYSWYPINFWDPREGLARDNAGALAGTQCTANGIMNAVELDVGNLNLWLQGLNPYGAGSGTLVNSILQNGYVLYFSDRRGMRVDPNAVGGAAVNGEYGFEDIINSGAGAAVGTPDNALEPVTAGYNLDRTNNVSYSPEDSDENGLLDNWGAVTVGNGFSVNTNTAPPDPYQTVDCLGVGRQNIVTGARHVLKLVDGSITNLPMARPPQVAAPQGGFTVASENPVYIQGNYNSDAADTVWAAGADDARGHAAAAIIADAVSLLSNNWTDLNSMTNPQEAGAPPGAKGLAQRVPVPTYYRVAIAAGKNMNFPQLGPADFGTDGGIHNFLRLLENWGGVGLFYRGSLVSLYYSQYNTGVFKCCTEVYGAPTRNFSFDTDFQNPNNLPPGTPMLQDINNLSERQDFTPQ